MKRGALVLALAAGSVFGCNSSTMSPITSTDSGAAFYSCDTEMRPHYGTGDGGLHQAASKAGTYMAVIQTVSPDPAIKGTDTMTVQIVDGTGAPVDGLTMKATPYMPDHTHGTSVKAVVTAGGGGMYTITPLYLYMAGYWEITLDLTPATGTPDSVVLPICIQG